MKNKKIIILSLFTAFLLVLAACGKNNESINEDAEHSHENMEGMDHSEMDMSSSGEVPEGLKVAENPKFEVGSKAMIKEAHMEGMEDAEATIVGAYDTTVYTISYTPTTGGEKVESHKWVIHEEIPDAQANPYKSGDIFVIGANHMEGMEGATATVDSAEQTTMYIIDFKLTTTGEEVKNHKWVTESELSPVKDE